MAKRSESPGAKYRDRRREHAEIPNQKYPPKPREEAESLARYLKSVRTFAAPPAKFDPMRASRRELAAYGFPRRPNIDTEPELAALFRKAYARPIRTIRAEVDIDDVLLKAARRRAVRVHDGRFSPGGWGGVIAQTSNFGFNPPEPAVSVYGEWSVPTMQPDFDNPKTAMTVGFWVGLDGSGATNNQVLQAGTAATVTGDKVDYWAWFEWFPAPPVRITNFPIAPGDLVTVLVCALPSGKGYASMLNRQTGVTTNVSFDPPPGITSKGGTAEWIVEGISSDLPNWVLMGFHNCSAGTKNHRMDISLPTITEIAGASKNLTISVAWQANNTVLVFWEGVR
jgi:hypothetical protein